MSYYGDILVLGTGVVGRATAALFADSGRSVFGYDPDPAAASLFPGVALEREHALREWAAIIICVPTPTVDGRMGEAPLRSALQLIREMPRPSAAPRIVAIRSTLVPGTMDRLVRSSLEPLLADGDVQVCHWPSFARERQAATDERNPRQVVIGRYENDIAVEVFIKAALSHLGRDIAIVTPTEAELSKHGANLYNSFKISFFNALADWSAERGAEGQKVASIVASVAEGAWNPDYGTKVGPAFGGACLPKDMEALATQLSADGSSHLGLLDAIREVNSDPRRTRSEPGASD